MINPSNYEEWFILYMDGELNAVQKAMLDDFLLSNPHLQEELNMLLGTKLPAEDVVLYNKENLQASAMKLNIVDESLLRLIDNELTAAERKAVEEKIITDSDFRLQHANLLQTKSDPAEIVSYPNKNELYRHTERATPLFPVWMRIAVAVMLILFAAFFFLYNAGNKQVLPGTDVAVNAEKAPVQKITPPAEATPETTLPAQQQNIIAKAEKTRQSITGEKEVVAVSVTFRPKIAPPAEMPAQATVETLAIERAAGLQIDVAELNSQPVTTLNNSVANLPVTSLTPASYNLSESPEEAIVTDGDDKRTRTPAKGFLRKVSRFIERRTGIGTVNADNELLIGALALKLN